MNRDRVCAVPGCERDGTSATVQTPSAAPLSAPIASPHCERDYRKIPLHRVPLRLYRARAARRSWHPRTRCFPGQPAVSPPLLSGWSSAGGLDPCWRSNCRAAPTQGRCERADAEDREIGRTWGGGGGGDAGNWCGQRGMHQDKLVKMPVAVQFNRDPGDSGATDADEESFCPTPHGTAGAGLFVARSNQRRHTSGANLRPLGRLLGSARDL